MSESTTQRCWVWWASKGWYPMTEALTLRAFPSFAPALLSPPSGFAGPSLLLLSPDIFLLCFLFVPWWPEDYTVSPCLVLSVKVPLCMSAASLRPDLHTLWSSILYIADALWCMDLCGRRASSRDCAQQHATRHTHATQKDKSGLWQSFADISPLATTRKSGAAAYMQLGLRKRGLSAEDIISAQTLGTANKELNGMDN